LKTSEDLKLPKVNVAAYLGGVLLGILFYLLRLTGRIKIKNWHKFPKKPQRTILVSNHPSLWEPILAVTLFFRDYLFHPNKYAPWSTPDKRNYYDRWYWRIFKCKFIPVPRGDSREELRTYLLMKKVLEKGENLILFGEGGRTHKGSEIIFSRSMKHRIRPLKMVIAKLACQTGATIVPVWFEGTDRVLPNRDSFRPYWWQKILPGKGIFVPRLWKSCKLTIGDEIEIPIFSSKQEEKEAVNKLTATIATKLLNLAEEG
jgi:1-acyl-sn-glycerol-3-phosphate acyltransferase